MESIEKKLLIDELQRKKKNLLEAIAKVNKDLKKYRAEIWWQEKQQERVYDEEIQRGNIE